MEFLAKSSTASDNLSVSAFSLNTIGTCLFDIDDHICRVKFVHIKVKEFINELCNRLGVMLLWHIELLDHFEVFLEESICLIHAIYFFVNVFRRIVVPSSF